MSEEEDDHRVGEYPAVLERPIEPLEHPVLREHCGPGPAHRDGHGMAPEGIAVAPIARGMFGDPIEVGRKVDIGVLEPIPVAWIGGASR